MRSQKLACIVVLAVGLAPACAAPRPRAAAPLPPGEWWAAPWTFAGRGWRARSGEGRAGPGNNLWSAGPPGVELDARGVLRLRVMPDREGWRSAEVSTPLPEGRCRIRVAVDAPFAAWDPAVVLGVFVYRDDASEFDFEVATWGAPGPPVGLFTLVPATAPGHQRRFPLPARGPIDVELTWGSGALEFAARDASGTLHARWMVQGADVPPPGGHRLHLNLWLREGAPRAGRPVEVTVTDAQVVCDAP